MNFFSSSLDCGQSFKSVIRDYGPLGPFFVGLVALWLAYSKNIRDYWNRPKLKFYFDSEQECYYHTLAHGYYDEILKFNNCLINIHRPFFNSRIKVINYGKTTARKVQSRIEKIELVENNGLQVNTVYYHPTDMKWSGQQNWDAVDIVPYSHFFLDLFWSTNQTLEEIIVFNSKIYEADTHISNADLKHFVSTVIQPSSEICWNVWVDQPFSRGIPNIYKFEGNIRIYIHLVAENCKPKKYIANVKWAASNWSNPEINITSKRDKKWNKNKHVRNVDQ